MSQQACHRSRAVRKEISIMNQCIAYCGGMDPKDFAVTTRIFPDAKRDAYQNYAKTIKAVSNWKADAAVVPFEKSLSGEIGHVVDLMFASDLFANRVVSNEDDSQTVHYAVLSRDEDKDAPESDYFLLMFTVKNAAGTDGSAVGFTFGDISFSMTGTYVYKITETAGEDETIEYDSTEYTATVTVSRDTDSGELQTPTVVYTKADGTSASEAAFTNTQKKGNLTITKTFAGNTEKLRDEDKAKALGLHVQYTEHGAPYYQEAYEVYECELIYKAPFEMGNMTGPGKEFYANRPNTKIHHMYIGRILSARRR